jgi:hypothetical protein
MASLNTSLPSSRFDIHHRDSKACWCTHRSGYKEGRRLVAFPTPHSTSSPYHPMAPRRSSIFMKGKAPAAPEGADPLVKRPRGRPPGSGKRGGRGGGKGGRGGGHVGEASSLAPTGDGESLPMKRPRGHPRGSRDKTPRHQRGAPALGPDLAPDPAPSCSKREKPEMVGSRSTWDLLVRLDAPDRNRRLRLPSASHVRLFARCRVARGCTIPEVGAIGTSPPRVP